MSVHREWDDCQCFSSSVSYIQKWELGHTVCDILVYIEENTEKKKGKNIEKVLNM